MPVQEGENPDFPSGDVPPKGDRYRPPPPGPSGGPAGGFTGFGGGRMGPRILRGVTGFGYDGMPLVSRRRMDIPPGIMPGPPGRSDTVPAMLSPGEVVMNNGVTSDPATRDALLGMNMQGAQQMGPQGYSQGGLVPDGGGGGRLPSRALRILRLLLELDDEDGGGMEPEGFAFGGIAGTSRTPGGDLSGGGLGSWGRNMAAKGRFGPNLERPELDRRQAERNAASPTGFGYTRDAAGNVTNYDPNNPWGGWQGNTGATGGGAVYRMLGQAGQAGAFDPRGNQMLLRSMEEGARGDADALVRRSMTAADLYGLDPAQQASAKMKALQSSGQGVQDIMARTRAGVLGEQDAYLKNLMSQLLGADIGYGREEQTSRNQRIAQQNQNTNANKNWWQGAIGAGLGGWAGGGFKTPGGGSRPAEKS